MKYRVLAFLISLVFGTTALQAQPQQFSYVCDFQGVQAKMNISVEVVSKSGRITRPGSSWFTGIVPAGDYIVYTEGEVRSPNAYYIFQGENDFATFTDMKEGGQFLVQFVLLQGGLAMVINPFQPPVVRGFSK